MKNNEIPIIFNDIENPSSIRQIYKSINKLEKVSEEVFANIKRQIGLRRQRLSKIQKKVLHLMSIMSFLKEQNTILHIKSRYKYPATKIPVSRPSVYSDTFTSPDIKDDSEAPQKISSKKPSGSIEDVFVMNEALDNIETIMLKNEKDKIAPILNKFVSGFQFDNRKNLVFGKSTDTINRVDYKKERKRKVIQAAPISIIEKVKLTGGRKKNLLSGKTVDVQMPKNVKLNNIADFDIDNIDEGNNNLIEEDTYREEFYIDEGDNEEVIDNNDVQLPIDVIVQRRTTLMRKEEEKSTTPNENKGSEEANNAPSTPTIPNSIEKKSPSKEEEKGTLDEKKTPPPSLPVVPQHSGIPSPPPLPEKFKFVPTAETSSSKEEKRYLTMQEEIGENPISRLKEVGTIKVKNIEKKTQNTQSYLMDSLREQIRLRFRNLNQNRDSSGSSSSESESD